MSELERFSTILYDGFCTVSYGFLRFPTFVFFHTGYYENLYFDPILMGQGLLSSSCDLR